MWLDWAGRPVLADARAILLQVGFTRARVTATLRELLPHDFTLTAESRGGMFLWHFPSSCPDRTLSCTLPDEARTFLTPCSARLPGTPPRAALRQAARHPRPAQGKPTDVRIEACSIWGHSSVGRASRWQREGQEFESPCLHQKYPMRQATDATRSHAICRIECPRNSRWGG